jgi:hypothetical protein
MGIQRDPSLGICAFLDRHSGAPWFMAMAMANMATAWFMAPADSGRGNFPCRLQFLLSSFVCLWYLYVSVTGSGSWMNLGRTATFLAGLGSFQVSYSYGTDFHGFSMFFFFSASECTSF